MGTTTVGSKEIAKAITATGKAAKTSIGLAGEAWAAWQDGALKDYGEALIEDPTPIVEVSRDVADAVRAVSKLAPLWKRGDEAVPALPPVLRISAVKTASDSLQAAPGDLLAGSGGTLADEASQLGSPLGMLNLGVGLANLGVGLYNAYQLSKVRAEVSEMHLEMKASFRDIQHVLDVQSKQLAMLLQGQDKVSSQIEALRREMVSGFTAVLDQLGDMESRRRAHELQEKSFKVTKSWQAVLGCIAEDERPNDNDLRRLGDSAIELEAWTETVLRSLPAGSPARLPYFVAKALAIRASADARIVENGSLSKASVRELEGLISDIDEEAKAAVDGKTLYEIGVALAPVIAQYVALRRGLKRGATLTGVLPKECVAGWDDGLVDFRLLARGLDAKGSPTVIPLGTLSDLRWYLDWTGLDSGSTDLRQVREVSARELLDRLGVPAKLSPLYSSCIPGLLMMALPKYRIQAQARLNGEFQWRVPIQLAAAPASKPKEEASTPEPLTRQYRTSFLHRGVVRFEDFELRFEATQKNSSAHAVLCNQTATLGMYASRGTLAEGARAVTLYNLASYPNADHLNLATTIRVHLADDGTGTVKCEFAGDSPETYNATHDFAR